MPPDPRKLEFRVFFVGAELRGKTIEFSESELPPGPPPDIPPYVKDCIPPHCEEKSGRHYMNKEILACERLDTDGTEGITYRFHVIRLGEKIRPDKDCKVYRLKYATVTRAESGEAAATDGVSDKPLNLKPLPGALVKYARHKEETHTLRERSAAWIHASTHLDKGLHTWVTYKSSTPNWHSWFFMVELMGDPMIAFRPDSETEVYRFLFEVCKAMRDLHRLDETGYIHGNPRGSHVLVEKKEDGTVAVKLLGFKYSVRTGGKLCTTDGYSEYWAHTRIFKPRGSFVPATPYHDFYSVLMFLNKFGGRGIQGHGFLERALSAGSHLNFPYLARTIITQLAQLELGNTSHPLYKTKGIASFSLEEVKRHILQALGYDEAEELVSDITAHCVRDKAEEKLEVLYRVCANFSIEQMNKHLSLTDEALRTRLTTTRTMLVLSDPELKKIKDYWIRQAKDSLQLWCDRPENQATIAGFSSAAELREYLGSHGPMQACIGLIPEAALLKLSKDRKIKVINSHQTGLIHMGGNEGGDACINYYIPKISLARTFEDQQKLYKQFWFSHLLFKAFSSWESVGVSGADWKTYRYYLKHPENHSPQGLMTLVDGLGQELSYNCFFIHLLKTAQKEGDHDLLPDFLGELPGTIVQTICRRGEFAERAPRMAFFSETRDRRTCDRAVLQAFIAYKVAPKERTRKDLLSAYATRA